MVIFDGVHLMPRIYELGHDIHPQLFWSQDDIQLQTKLRNPIFLSLPSIDRYSRLVCVLVENRISAKTAKMQLQLSEEAKVRHFWSYILAGYSHQVGACWKGHRLVESCDSLVCSTWLRYMAILMANTLQWLSSPDHLSRYERINLDRIAKTYNRLGYTRSEPKPSIIRCVLRVGCWIEHYADEVMQTLLSSRINTLHFPTGGSWS